MEYKVYNATMVDEDCGLEVVSLVENPAVEVDFFAFNNEQPQELYFRDEVEHCITGVALRADTPIYRNNINGAPGYIVFTRDFIKELVIKYSKDQRLNNVSLNHDGNNVSNCFFYESYIIDEEKGIKPTQFKDIPNGSWVVSFKIDNPDVWEAIVNKDVKGFSIEGLFGFEEAKLQKEQSMEEFIDELLFSVSDNQLIKACKENE